MSRNRLWTSSHLSVISTQFTYVLDKDPKQRILTGTINRNGYCESLYLWVWVLQSLVIVTLPLHVEMTVTKSNRLILSCSFVYQTLLYFICTHCVLDGKLLRLVWCLKPVTTEEVNDYFDNTLYTRPFLLLSISFQSF